MNIISPTEIRRGGRPDIAAGSGVEGFYGSRYNEIHTSVPGTQNYRSENLPRDIGTWVDAKTGLLRFDRLPDINIGAGRYQNSNGGQFDGYIIDNITDAAPIVQLLPTVSQPLPESITAPETVDFPSLRIANINDNLIDPFPTEPFVPLPEDLIPTRPTTPPVIIQPPGRSAPTVLPPSFVGVNLNDVVKFSSTTIDRQYVKGTMRVIEKASISAVNTSTNIDVKVELTGINGVNFMPSSFELTRGSTSTIDILFDSVVVDTFPEGTTSINCIVNLTTTNTIGDTIIQPTPLEPITVVDQSIFTVWIESRYQFRTDPSQIRNISAVVNQLPVNGRIQTPQINYQSGLPQNSYIQWTRTFKWQAGTTYRFNGRVDDGIRIYVNSNIILNSWRRQSSTPFAAQFTPTLTGDYSVVIEYYNDKGIGQCVVNLSEGSNVVLPPTTGSGGGGGGGSNNGEFVFGGGRAL
jgi:hypothetical protein